MATPFLDTNVLLRHFLQDHADHSPRATVYLSRIERGEIRVRLLPTVVFETVFTLQRLYRVSREDIRDAVLPLIELSGIVLPGKRSLHRAFALYAGLNVSFADAYHAAEMERLSIDETVSFDRGFDRIPGVRRVEPA